MRVQSLEANARLTRAGLMLRQSLTTNSRMAYVRVTPAGVRLREAKSVLDPVRVEQVLAHLPPSDRDAALKGLELLALASERHMRSL